MDKEIIEFKRLLIKKLNRYTIENQQFIVGSKDEKRSLELIEKGHEMLASPEHNSVLHYTIWDHFSTSIAIAIKNSETLARAYESRSTLLIHLCKYEESIMDIDSALKITKNNALKIEILCRKIECLHALGSKGNEKILEEAESLLKTINDETKRQHLENIVNKTKRALNEPAKSINREKDPRIEMLKTLHEQHVTNDFSSVDIQCNKKHGRHLIAKRDIKPGEVIYIEEPYTMCMNTRKIRLDCSYCNAVAWAAIQCDHCPYAVFCSEECKKDAWEKYHDLECPILSMALSSVKHNSVTQLAVRILSIAFKEAGSIDKLKTELTAFDKIRDPTKGFIENGKIKSMGFKSIYALANDVPHNILEDYITIHTNMLTALGKNPILFEENFMAKSCVSYKDNENAVFIGALALRLFRISILNHHKIWNGNVLANYVCQNGLDRYSCWKNECCSRGVYIAPITALLNHSCDPNARRCFSYDKKVILYAIQPIKKGSQIFDCYQQEFYELDYVTRRVSLTQSYNFNCVCLACQNEWPDKKAFKGTMTSAESQLALEYKDWLSSANSHYDKSTIIHLGKGIERGSKISPQPVFTTIGLIICMNKIFEYLYGIYWSIPVECNNP